MQGGLRCQARHLKAADHRRGVDLRAGCLRSDGTTQATCSCRNRRWRRRPIAANRSPGGPRLPPNLGCAADARERWLNTQAGWHMIAQASRKMAAPILISFRSRPSSDQSASLAMGSKGRDAASLDLELFGMNFGRVWTVSGHRWPSSDKVVWSTRTGGTHHDRSSHQQFATNPQRGKSCPNFRKADHDVSGRFQRSGPRRH